MLKSRHWLFLITVFIISGCAVHYLPVPDSNIKIINDSYYFQGMDTEIVAKHSYWVRDPQNLNDYFTTFYVSVKNRTDAKLDISNNDFALLDQYGYQFDPLSVQQIEDVLLHNELQYLIVKNIEEQDEKQFLTIDSQTDKLEEWRRAKRNLITDSFTFGEIYPQAKRSGFLFFPKVNIKNDELTLIYRSQQFKFRR